MIFNRGTKKYKYVSQISPDFFELEIVGFSEFKSPVMSVDIVATPLADRDGYGIAQTLAAVTDRGYWLETMLLYQWPKFMEFKQKGWYATRGYSVQYHIWQDRKGYILEESDIIKDIRGERRVVIKDGDPINLRMEIKGEDIYLQVIGRETYEVKYPSYGAQTFIGTDGPNAKGYYTGFATECYHISEQYGAVNPRPVVVKMREPSEVKKGYIEIAESRRPFFRTDIDENILLLISPVEFYPKFNMLLGPGRFSGSSKEFSIEVQEREE
ncbi:MAG: hypothetical protein QXP36_04920 [Conexivisphaerales archaeon]